MKKSKYPPRDLKYIHFWKSELKIDELQAWLDRLAVYHFQFWVVLLDEKLKRNEIT